MAGYDVGVYGTELYGVEPTVCLPVRELPPLRQSIEAITPNGKYYRWSEDEPNPAYVPSALRHSSTMPGGYETLDVTLPRKPGTDYADLERLTTIRVRDAGGDIIGEYRLERAPSVSGDQIAISPSAVGWQAHLEDDKSARMIYVDRDVSRWTEAPPARRLVLATASVAQGKIPVAIGNGGIVWEVPNEALVTNETTEVQYDIGAGLACSRIEYRGSRTGASWAGSFEAATVYTDDSAAFPSASSEALTLDNTIRVATAFTDDRYVMLRARSSAGFTPAAGHQQAYDLLAVYGNHGHSLTSVSGDASGMLASTVVIHAVTRWAPLLTAATGVTVMPSSVVIPHLAFPDATTAGEIIRQASRFELPYWAVWDNREFHWDPSRTPRKRWRARISPAQLEETGPQVDRLWESIVVQYQDVDGSTRTVGPVGSGADTESADLKDDDPDNPANKLGIIRRDLLTMGVGTAASATAVGRQFLEQAKLLDTSGRARIVGHIADDHGILYPYTSVRAGDTISFTDASDTSERRIVRCEHDRPSRSCSIDLDAPPDGLSALLERLGVSLVALGL